MDRIKVGIIFGGPSREREISFAGGRTVYDNLNKAIFEAVPIFVDSHKRFILLDWEYIYKGTIRDFYPPVASLPDSPHHFQIYVESLGDRHSIEDSNLSDKAGKQINPTELPGLIDVAFLALHGSFGEDGQIQGLLESIGLPYTGSGIRACSIGMDKAFQKKIMAAGGFASPKVIILNRQNWIEEPIENIYKNAVELIGLPFVIRPANQGSSIGVRILEEDSDIEDFKSAVQYAFFRKEIHPDDWTELSEQEKVNFLRQLTDIREGLGFPVRSGHRVIYHPEDLFTFFEAYFQKNEKSLLLESFHTEQRVVIESFIAGREFSCIVIRDSAGNARALPPTEIVKGREMFDYRSKYMPGLSRKVTPIQLPNDQIENIRAECERLFNFLEFNTYARIDGFYSIENDRPAIYLNDPNTTSGMMPSSFFFHQAAEIGLNPSQFLTYILRTSLWERRHTALELLPRTESLIAQLDKAIATLKTDLTERKKIAVIMGGYSFERHISVESGRNVFEKLASSKKYEPIPVFLIGDNESHKLYQIPINLLLKDNADDIRDKILNFKKHPVIEKIKSECADITRKYASRNVVFEPQHITYEALSQMADGVFIALHGRPGEDGEIQKRLQKAGLPFNGSDVDSSQITINKFETLRILRAHGFSTATQMLVSKSEFLNNKNTALEKVEATIDYPLVAKPVDDGCSSAVMLIRNRKALATYLELLFRNNAEGGMALRETLNLSPREEFPIKEEVLIESLITADGAKKFLEITGGMLTHTDQDGQIVYEIFEPSEVLATGDVLSLEEKFLAGEGQNITPARFSSHPDEYDYIARQVKADLEAVARILQVKGYCRIDAFVRIADDNAVETIIIEVNSLPGMTPATCIYHQAALNGYKPYDFIDKILEFGFNEKTARANIG